MHCFGFCYTGVALTNILINQYLTFKGGLSCIELKNCVEI